MATPPAASSGICRVAVLVPLAAAVVSEIVQLFPEDRLTEAHVSVRISKAVSCAPVSAGVPIDSGLGRDR